MQMFAKGILSEQTFLCVTNQFSHLRPGEAIGIFKIHRINTYIHFNRQQIKFYTSAKVYSLEYLAKIYVLLLRS